MPPAVKEVPDPRVMRGGYKPTGSWLDAARYHISTSAPNSMTWSGGIRKNSGVRVANRLKMI
jgi:hypothetical protein